ncbi:MAG: CCA tRNA nucleotidyltransferase, partial [Clostridia bacterium]|nr:CCA tRNA nucleotidyltransferase [Clostridia bacterium]
MFDEKTRVELQELASYFPIDKPLYAVGGCVRDHLRGKGCYDIDLAGGVKPEELIEILSKSSFGVVSASPRLGTVVIKGKSTYEYTTFRIDSYPSGSGVHTPTQVEFTDDLTTDAKRRDFKCNAIYYNIKDAQIIDPLGGIKDIEHCVLSTTVEPDTVLSQDGLRILRLARFVSTLGYEIEEQTYDSAKRLVGRLNEISVERIREELNRILSGEHCYKALCLLRDIGAFKIILPELAANDGVPQKAEYHKYDVLEHTFKVVEACPPQVRLAGLFHDIAKGVCQAKDGNMYFHNLVGAEMTEEIMTRLKYSNRQIERTTRMVKLHMFDINGNTKESKCRRFIANNFDIFDDMLDLFEADCIGTG